MIKTKHIIGKVFGRGSKFSFKRFFYNVLIVFLTEIIIVFSGHIFTMLYDPRALKDGQYPIAFVFWAGEGLIAGILLCVGIHLFAKREPSFTKRAGLLIAVYCVVLVISAVVIEKIMIKDGGEVISLFLIPFTPFLFVLSLPGLIGTAISPLATAVSFLLLSPLVLALAVLYRLSKVRAGRCKASWIKPNDLLKK